MPCTREHTGEKPNNLDKGGREKPNKSIAVELQCHSIRQMYNENKSSKHQCVEKVKKKATGSRVKHCSAQVNLGKLTAFNSAFSNQTFSIHFNSNFGGVKSSN